MLRNYFKIAWRNLMKSKVFSFINVFGLTIGLTSFLLIALYIFDEFTYDSFHSNADNIYRLVQQRSTPEGDEIKSAGAGYQVSARGKTDIPGIKDVARLTVFGRVNVANTQNTNVFYENYLVGSPGFLTSFDFTVLYGDRNTALNAPHSVIVTEETAQKIFNTSAVIGKTLKIGGDTIPFEITAVLQDFPVNSHLFFNLLVSESTVGGDDFNKFISTDWRSSSFQTYLVLNKGADPEQAVNKINQLVAANDKTSNSHYILQPLKDIHFYSNDIEGDSGRKGNLAYMYVFAVVALFVLLIACINYINLTTARFVNRAKEIGIRKVSGASRKILAAQFLSEAFLVVIIALLFALALTKLLLPWFNSFTEKRLVLGLQADYRIWIGIGITLIIVILLSGIYPALFQSGTKPLSLLKSKINVGKGNISLRRSLVVSQFALSIIMMVATLTVYLQMNYVKSRDMGFNREQLVVIDINSGKIRQRAETIKTEIGKLPGIKKVSVSSRVPGEWKDIPRVKVRNEKIVNPEGNDMYFLGADDQFLETYQISLLKGRNFIPGSNADSSSVIINETAAKLLGITELSEQTIDILLEQPVRVRVAGIVKDFNFQSLREPLAPMVIGFKNNAVQNIDYFTVKAGTGNMEETLKKMEAVLLSIDQDHLFEYHFLDNQWNLFYREDHIRETIFFSVAILTILIACLGLFGLATYSAEQRIKEIGIRKVLGASVANIVSMLSKDFLKLVIISALLAFPVAWWAMNSWLQDFAYHISVSWWIFLVSGVTALVIAFLTISFQAFKAGIANPVKSLRSE